MKTTIFDDIYCLEDLQKQKLRLEKKLRVTEKSIYDKTDVTKLLFNNKLGLGRLFGGNDGKIAVLESILPLGLNYILKQFQKKPDKKLIKKLIIYTAIGSVSALLVYQYLKNRKIKPVD